MSHKLLQWSDFPIAKTCVLEEDFLVPLSRNIYDSVTGHWIFFEKLPSGHRQMWAIALQEHSFASIPFYDFRAVLCVLETIGLFSRVGLTGDVRRSSFHYWHVQFLWKEFAIQLNPDMYLYLFSFLFFVYNINVTILFSTFDWYMSLC